MTRPDRPGGARTVAVTNTIVPGRRFPGRIARIAPGVTAQARSFAIQITASNPDGAVPR